MTRAQLRGRQRRGERWRMWRRWPGAVSGSREGGGGGVHVGPPIPCSGEREKRGKEIAENRRHFSNPEHRSTEFPQTGLVITEYCPKTGLPPPKTKKKKKVTHIADVAHARHHRPRPESTRRRHPSRCPSRCWACAGRRRCGWGPGGSPPPPPLLPPLLTTRCLLTACAGTGPRPRRCPLGPAGSADPRWQSGGAFCSNAPESVAVLMLFLAGEGGANLL